MKNNEAKVIKLLDTHRNGRTVRNFRELGDIISDLTLNSTSIDKSFFEGCDDEYIRRKLIRLDSLQNSLKSMWDNIKENRKKTETSDFIIDELLTYVETAKILKVTKQTIINYVERNELKVTEINQDGKRGIVRIKRSDLNIFLAKYNRE